MLRTLQHQRIFLESLKVSVYFKDFIGTLHVVNLSVVSSDSGTKCCMQQKPEGKTMKCVNGLIR